MGNDEMTKDKAKKLLINTCVIFVWILIWKGVSLLVNEELLIAPPEKVLYKIISLAGTADFWLITANSVYRITVGFLTGAAAGTLFAIITCSSPVIYAFFKPILSIIKATPVVSFIILALVWLQGGKIPAFISFLMVFPIIWGNVSKGITQTDRNLLDMAKVYHLPKTLIFKKIYINSVLPYFTAAATTSMGLAWKAGIAAEVIATPRFAIGTSIYDSKIYLETVDLFAWSIIVIVMSVILEKIVMILLNSQNRSTKDE
ncbi:MAG: ABC transporter permease [Saccharofermentanales bacterium]